MTKEEAAKLKPGDRVEISADWAVEDDPVCGTYVGIDNRYNDLLVERDDEEIGGGPNSEWLCSPQHLTLLENESAGHKFKVGDRVKYTYTPGLCGTVVGYENGNVCVKRDDSVLGSGPFDSWTSSEYSIELLIDEDEDDFDVRRAITKECDELKELLLTKNDSYGNSVFEPLGILSDASVRERLLIRIEDKLARLNNGYEFPSEDTTKDLIGYLILLRIADKREAAL